MAIKVSGFLSEDQATELVSQLGDQVRLVAAAHNASNKLARGSRCTVFWLPDSQQYRVAYFPQYLKAELHERTHRTCLR